jgi:hypothetical protein
VHPREKASVRIAKARVNRLERFTGIGLHIPAADPDVLTLDPLELSHVVSYHNIRVTVSSFDASHWL